MSNKLFSKEVPHSNQEASHTYIRRSSANIPPVLGLPDSENSGQLILTCYENFQASVKNHPNNNFLGFRPIKNKKAENYKFWSYKEVNEKIDKLLASFLHLNLIPLKPNDLELKGRGVLGLLSKNRPEWVLLENCCYAINRVVVPMYDSLNKEGIKYVVKHSEMTTIACSIELLGTVIEAVDKDCPLKNVVLMDLTNFDENEFLKISSKNSLLKIYKMSDLMVQGQNLLVKSTKLHDPPTSKDIATFCYTSGTTGEPKAALLTHENLLTNIAAVTAVIPRLESSDVHMSYLPLPHMMERLIQFYFIWAGASIGFFQGDQLKLLDDLNCLKPTAFVSVPRLFNRIKDKVMTQVEQSSVKSFLFKKAFSAKLSNLKDSNNLNHFLYDSVLFGKIKKNLGLQRCRFMITGSAPISADTLTWFRVVFGVPVMEGYGQTECTLCCTLQMPDDNSVMNVGGPIPCNEIRLESVPEMGYAATDKLHNKEPCLGRGEIQIRGPNVFQGYYKMPDKTKETINKDGWLLTGDIGLFTADGKLKIIDRKKNIFKLAQGEYVAAEKIENIVCTSKFVAQSFVYGDSFKTFLVGVYVINPDNAKVWAETNGMAGAKLEEICRSQKFVKEIETELNGIFKKAKLPGFEFVKKFHIETEPWTPENILTPTFKLKRNLAKDKYIGQINKLYEEKSKL